MLVTLLVFLAVLSILVYVHEFGHFLLAKLNGVRVEEFAFGFKPRLFSKKVGETEYAINAVPLGGYVKLYGEDASEMGPDSFRSKTIFQRFLILFAGAFMNLVLGWLILIVLFAAGFDPLMPGVAKNPFVTGKQTVEITTVSHGSPAEQAGLKTGDKIISLDGKSVANDLEFIVGVNARKGQAVDLKIERNAQIVPFHLNARTNPPAGEGALGVVIQSTGKVRSSVLGAPAAAFYETGRMIGLSAQGVGTFVKTLVVRHKVSEDVTGIIGIGAMTGVTRRLGLSYLAQLVAVVSVGLGVINLVPILPLDGGHIAGLIYEKVAGRPLSERQQGALATAGLVLVMLLFVVVTYKDIVRFDVFKRIFS